MMGVALFLFGLIVGFFFASACSLLEKRDAVKNGFMEIGGECYRMEKMIKEPTQ